jgi:hypothetical protein
MVNFIINNLLNLKYIRLDGCKMLKNCFSTITRDTLKLTYIRVDSTDITDEGICAITSKCPKLMIFYALDVYFTNKMAKSIGDNCPKLETLQLSNGYPNILTNESLVFIAENCRLLNVFECY